MPALGLALLLDLVQALLGAFDRLSDHAAVQLDLFFTRAAAHPDAPTLPLQMGPASHQPGADVLQARQLHLQLAFMAAGALGKNLENQQGPVVDRQLHVALKVALLCRAQRLVEKNFNRTVLLGQKTDFIRLAAADKKRSIRCSAFTNDARYWRKARCLGEQAELFQSAIKMRQTQVYTHEDNGGVGSGRRIRGTQVGESGFSAGPHKRASACQSGGRDVSVRAFGRREIHGAAGNNGRNGVFVDHLRHGIAQQDDVLVKGFNLPLQLDAIDEVNRHWHMLPTQSVEERVLKKLAFVAHDILRVQECCCKTSPYHSNHAAPAQSAYNRGKQGNKAGMGGLCYDVPRSA